MSSPVAILFVFRAGSGRIYTEYTHIYTYTRPPGYFVDFLNFASDFAPDQLSDSGKLASFQNGAPNTLCFPSKFPETQSAEGPPSVFLLRAPSLLIVQTQWSLGGPSSQSHTLTRHAAPRAHPLPRPGGKEVRRWDSEGGTPFCFPENLGRAQNGPCTLNVVGLLSLDVETRGLPPLAPPPRVCGEVFLTLLEYLTTRRK